MFNLIKTAYRKDPALKRGLGYLEVIFYPGIQAVVIYRITHFLHRYHIPIIPRAISYIGRILTGAEIHPAAKIGKDFFIDHASGVVIGETAEVGDNVMIYHGVTMGGRGWWRDTKDEKRHPTIEDNVIIGVNAVIIGPVTVGKNSMIGPLALVIDDVPENSIVVGCAGRRLEHSRESLQPTIPQA